MKEQKTEIKKIVLSIEGKELVLSVDGAKKLKTLLNDLFGREVVKETHHYDHYRYPWTSPFYYGVSSNAMYVSDSNQSLQSYPVDAVLELKSSNIEKDFLKQIAGKEPTK